MKVRFIGDVHGKFATYEQLLDGCEASIQVGDFGVGFGGTDPVYPLNHRFIRGNHDNPEVCKVHPNWIPDGRIEGDIMFIGGAWSIDECMRVEGRNWWRDEQLSYNDLQIFVDKAIMNLPGVMVTHDAPYSVCEQLFRMQPIKTRTQTALDEIFQNHKPKLWVFGHWHHDVVTEIDGTTFVCLNELSYFDLEMQ